MKYTSEQAVVLREALSKDESARITVREIESALGVGMTPLWLARELMTAQARIADLERARAEALEKAWHEGYGASARDERNGTASSCPYRSKP